MGDRAVEPQVVGAVCGVLKRLYPANPDIVLAREARAIVEALRSLSVDQRMEAMGMEPVAWDNPVHFPVQHVRLLASRLPRRERMLYGQVER